MRLLQKLICSSFLEYFFMHCHQLAKAVLSQLGHVFQVVLISLWPKESIVVIHFHLAAEIFQRNSTIWQTTH